MIPLTELLIFAATFLLSVLIVRKRNGKKKEGRRYPPSFPSLPIVGSLPFIRNFKNLAEFFMTRGLELGPVFTLKIGEKLIVVLNNLEAIEAAFVKHAPSFSGRGGTYAETNILNVKGKGIAFRHYSQDFARYRRLFLSIMREFGFGSKSKMEDLILTEIVELNDHIKKKNGKAFDPKEVVRFSISNVPHNMLLGKRRNLEDEEPCELFDQMNKYAVSMDPALEFFPILRFFPPHSQKLQDIIDANAKFFMLLEKEVHEIIHDKTSECFIRRYIDREGPNYDQEQLLYTVRDLFGASMETTSTALLWSIIYLTNHPHVAERIQKEIDSVVPRDRLPSGSDQPMLPYTEATVLEVLRLRPPLPLGLPHLTMEDTEVLGYFIPSNSVVIPNIKSAQMNNVDWPDADVFRPERFLDDENKLIGKNRVIPFSLGRRSCPGEMLARIQLFLFISGLVQNFSFRPPEGVQWIPDAIDPSIVDSTLPYTVRMFARGR